MLGAGPRGLGGRAGLAHTGHHGEEERSWQTQPAPDEAAASPRCAEGAAVRLHVLSFPEGFFLGSRWLSTFLQVSPRPLVAFAARSLIQPAAQPCEPCSICNCAAGLVAGALRGSLKLLMHALHALHSKLAALNSAALPCGPHSKLAALNSAALPCGPSSCRGAAVSYSLRLERTRPETGSTFETNSAVASVQTAQLGIDELGCKACLVSSPHCSCSSRG